MCPPCAAGKRSGVSTRGGTASTAASAGAVSGTRRRDRFVFGYGVSTPSAKRRCTTTARPWRSTSRRSSAIHSFVLSPVSAAKTTSGPPFGAGAAEPLDPRADVLGERDERLAVPHPVARLVAADVTGGNGRPPVARRAPGGTTAELSRGPSSALRLRCADARVRGFLVGRFAVVTFATPGSLRYSDACSSESRSVIGSPPSSDSTL